jgi:RNA polymerase sigma-70 factor (ECF subfamily)
MDYVDVVEASQAYRGELLAYCYRMLGSLHDAEDLVQETLLRAWRSASSYDPAKASLRTWLYRIATNVCLTALTDRSRRWLPAGLSGPSGEPDVGKLSRSSDNFPWLEPMPDRLLDPADVVVSRDTVRLAFVAALQHLPPRQRAVIILREVLALPAAEAASLLDMSVASVNSALQRARSTLAKVSPSLDGGAELSADAQRELLSKYVAAFEAMDVEALKRTLRADALLQMPPVPEWFFGPDSIGAFYETAFARGGLYRFVPTGANGQLAVGLYRQRETDTFVFLHIEVLTIFADGIARIDAFNGKWLAEAFELPDELD